MNIKKTMTNSTILAAAVAFLGLGVAPLQGQAEETDTRAMGNDSDLVSTLRAEGLTVFADLLIASDLADDFADEEALTFFVPTNAAFAEIASGVVEGTENARDAVFHLTAKGTTKGLDAMEDREQVKTLRPFGAVGGLTLERGEMGHTMVKDPDQSARLVGEPIWVGNHVIHVIDEVLLPAADESY